MQLDLVRILTARVYHINSVDSEFSRPILCHSFSRLLLGKRKRTFIAANLPVSASCWPLDGQVRQVASPVPVESVLSLRFDVFEFLNSQGNWFGLNLVGLFWWAHKKTRRYLLSRFWHYHRLERLNYCVR